MNIETSTWILNLPILRTVLGFFCRWSPESGWKWPASRPSEAATSSWRSLVFGTGGKECWVWPTNDGWSNNPHTVIHGQFFVFFPTAQFSANCRARYDWKSKQRNDHYKEGWSDHWKHWNWRDQKDDRNDRKDVRKEDRHLGKRGNSQLKRI